MTMAERTGVNPNGSQRRQPRIHTGSLFSGKTRPMRPGPELLVGQLNLDALNFST
jgi:hypothetical protein